MKEKKALRKELQDRRRAISPSRKSQAAKTVKQKVLNEVQGHPWVLSYASFSDELDTSLINKALAGEGRLLLPRINGNLLDLFAVSSISDQLQKHRFGMLEPISERCQQHPYDIVSIALVPALGFDSANQRIGYGKGYYDRLLAKLPKHTPTIGIAYKEQQIDEVISTHPHDIPVKKVLYF